MKNENAGSAQPNDVDIIAVADSSAVGDDTVILPLLRPWNGRTVGCYIRNSTAAQVGNDRTAFQADMVPYLHTLGYAARVYDEQGRSAGTLHRRKKRSGC